MRLPYTLLPLLTLLLVSSLATSTKHVGSSKRRNLSGAPPARTQALSTISHVSSMGRKASTKRRRKSSTSSHASSMGGKAPAKRIRKRRTISPSRRAYLEFSNPATSSIIEILNEILNTKGQNLLDSPEKQKLILANKESLVPLLLSMSNSFKGEQIKNRKWKKIKDFVFHIWELASGKSATTIPPLIQGAWTQRRNSWIILKDTKNHRNVPLLPSIDRLEEICRDPVNRHTILSRFAGTIGFTMILVATHASDVRAARNGDEVMDDPNVLPPNVVKLTDYTFQLNCVSSALAQAKIDAGILVTPPGSLIDWAEKVLEVALTHMVSSDGTDHGDGDDSYRMARPNDKNQGDGDDPYGIAGLNGKDQDDGDAAYRMVYDIALKIGKSHGAKHALSKRLDELYDKEQESKLPLYWPHRRYGNIQTLAVRLGDIFERLFQPHVHGQPMSNTSEDVHKLFTSKDPKVLTPAIKFPFVFKYESM